MLIFFINASWAWSITIKPCHTCYPTPPVMMGDRARWNDPKFNPCLPVWHLHVRERIATITLFIIMSQEANASYKCMDENNYNRDACLEYFKAYKECKKRMVGKINVC